MEPSRNRNKADYTKSEAYAGTERTAFVSLVNWRQVPGADLLSNIPAVTAQPIDWHRSSGRRRVDAWASIVDREVINGREAAAGNELMRIVQEISGGGGLGGRNLYMPRVDTSPVSASASRDRLVGLYQGRYLKWLRSTWVRPAKLVPSKAAHKQADGAVPVTVVLLVVVFGASLRAIDGKTHRRAGTAREYLSEGLRIYANT